MDAGAQNEEPTFDEALVMELLSRAAAEGGGHATGSQVPRGVTAASRGGASVCAAAFAARSADA